MGTLHCSWQFSGRFFFWKEIARGVPENGEALQNLIETFELTSAVPTKGELFNPLRPTERLGSGESHQTEVEGILLGLDESLALLTTFKKFYPPETVFGSSLLFWREASCFVLELLCKGRFLPGVSRSEGLLSSLWFPVMTDEVSQQNFLNILKAMPLVACISLDGRAIHPDAPEQALRGFLEHSTDTLVRLFLPRTRPFPDNAESASLNRRVLERWFEALWQKDSGRFTYLEPGLQGLVERVFRWQETVQPSSLSQQGRIVFKLDSLPGALVVNDETFCLSFGMVDGEQIVLPWEKNLSDGARAPGGNNDDESYFLRVLARESEVFPPLRRVLNQPFPNSVLLTTGEAYEFLKVVGPRIAADGHRVDLPPWWADRDRMVGLRLKVISDDISGGEKPRGAEAGGIARLASQELLRFSWQVAVGDSLLTLEEFEAISKSGVPFLSIGNRWVELEKDKVAETLAFVQKLNDRKQLSLFELLKLGFEDDDISKRFPVLDIRSSGWVQHLFERDAHPIPHFEVSPDFRGELRSYQAEGVNWLSFLTTLGLGGCLADDMGLGKTIQLLALISTLRQAAERTTGRLPPVLLIVPVSILSNWTQEMTRFTPQLKWHVHHGSERLQHGLFEEMANSVDVLLTTYNLAYRDETTISRVPWSMLVLDEAQNIKNPDTKQTQAIRRFARRSLEQTAANMPCQRFALTGTPLENRLEELWSILEFLNPGILGTLPEFRKSFLMPIERGETKEPLERLSRVVKPFVLRRLKSDPKILPDLPAKIEMDVNVPLTREQAQLYQSVLEEMLPELEHAAGMRRRGLVLATITRLKQVCDHPVLFLRDNSSLGGRSQKLERLEQLLEEIFAEGDKALIFTQFAEMGKLLRPYLEERFSREVLFLHGAVNKRDRDTMVKRFQTREGPSLFLLSLKAGGFGLNLTEANHVIHYDQWWNPAVEDQASDRAHRIGQTRKVQIRRLICQGTLEEKIAELHLRKKKLAQEVLQIQDESLTELSFSELKNLFELQTGRMTNFAENDEAEFDQVLQ